MCWGRVNWVQKNQNARANKLSSGTQNTMKSLDLLSRVSILHLTKQSLECISGAGERDLLGFYKLCNLG